MPGISTVSVASPDPAAALQQWEEAVSSFVGRTPNALRPHERKRCDALGSQPFHGRIEYGDLGALSLCRMFSTPNRFSRFSRPETADAHHDSSPLMLILQQRGHSHVEQNGARSALEAGDWCLLDTRLPFTWTSPSPCELVIVAPPRPTDDDLQAAVARSLARRANGSVGAARVIGSLVSEAFNQLEQLPAPSAVAVADAITGVLWSALRETEDGARAPSVRETQCNRLKACIEGRLADPGLSPESIAEQCRMSVRSVHRAFADHIGGSVTDYIWRRRLAHCALSLKDPVQSHRSITDIALSWGFANSAHFSRAFRHCMGTSPRTYRLAKQMACALES